MAFIAVEREIRVMQEVRAAARWQAERGFNGAAGTPLPAFMSTAAVRRIAALPTTFRSMVAAVREG